MQKLSSYDILAKDFFEKNEIKIVINPFKTVRGYKDKFVQVYWVTIYRHYANNAKNLVKNVYAPKKFEFEFTGSTNAYENNLPLMPYSILACLTKYDPETHENFCTEYGFDQDSIKGLETYKSVVKEWENVKGFFSEKELEELREIN